DAAWAAVYENETSVRTHNEFARGASDLVDQLLSGLATGGCVAHAYDDWAAQEGMMGLVSAEYMAWDQAMQWAFAPGDLDNLTQRQQVMRDATVRFTREYFFGTKCRDV